MCIRDSYYEGTYYLYATNTDMKDDSEMGFKVYTSKDLVHWHDAGMALKACDSWGEKMCIRDRYRPVSGGVRRAGLFQPGSVVFVLQELQNLS